MTNRDFVNNIEVNDATSATGVDLRNYDSVAFTSTGTIAVLESDETTGFEAVDASDLIVPEGGQEQNGAFTVGYRGTKRYVRATSDALDVVAVGYHLTRKPPGFSVDSNT